ncbi:cilia- and flagella-associated protein 57-like [Schistocerca gregaria]|uniref:cilia- and flagella-associated protein 57-like n=1 Tax=Schistocerca gregaria TaxID=7010 RepID=UPI00211E1A76|nr:cilia- and flagella-associated protein 57-like [Schistocerca gregaria]
MFPKDGEPPYSVGRTGTQPIFVLHILLCELITLGTLFSLIQLENEHAQIMNELNNDLTKMDECHKETLQSITEHYDLKLVFEYDRFHELEEADIKMRADYERELQELLETKAKCINDLIETYEKQVQEKAVEFENLLKQVEKQTQKHEEIKQQIEDDADHETVDLRTAYEQLLREERNISDSFRKEATVWKNRLKSLQKAGEECAVTFNETLIEHHKFQHKIASLEKDTEELKQELCQRDNALQDKEKGISDLKESNQELSKLKFILHYKTEELRNQIQPKDIQIQNKEEQMMDVSMNSTIILLQQVATYIAFLVLPYPHNGQPEQRTNMDTILMAHSRNSAVERNGNGVDENGN